jgi:hypothetical protein
MAVKLSTFVITYNRASLLETCLRAASFADELIVIDKSSTDNSAEVAARYADRVERVPWSPTVEETRAYAASLCRHEWILYLDDDEILSPETGPYLQRTLATCSADILAIPQRHYILGVHDERAYYWPEEHFRLFRQGAIEFIPTVHGGNALQSERRASIPVDSGVCTHHLSYQDVAGWIERTNRYTSRPNRIRTEPGSGDLIGFAHEQIDFWVRRTEDTSGNDYPAAVALLRAIYDMVDRLKTWETERGIDGGELFRIAQLTLVPAGAARNRRTAMPRNDGDKDEPAATRLQPADADGDDQRQMAMQGILVQLRAAEAELRERTAAARNSASCLTSTRRDLIEMTGLLSATGIELDDTRARLQQTCAAVRNIEARLTGAQQELERLGNSGRVFVRQYLPKLWRYLRRRLRIPGGGTIRRPACSLRPGGSAGPEKPALAKARAEP